MPNSRLCLTGLALASLAGLTLVACGTQLQKAEQTSSQGTAFHQALYQRYLALSQAEYDKGDYKDSDVFARRAMLAARGQAVPPEPVAQRAVRDDGAAVLLSESRQRLVATFGKGAVARTPDKAARAQTLYDCWLEEQEENRQPEDIAACRDGLMTLLAELEDDAVRVAVARAEALAAKSLAKTSDKPAAKPVLPAPVKTEGPAGLGTYIVFFELNQARLTAETKQILAEVVRAAKEAEDMRILATGHTDMVGDARANRKLARKRAEAVVEFLIDSGLDPLRVAVESRGEAEPLVPTGDEVPELQNRRVEIRFEPLPKTEGVPVASLRN